MMLQGQGLAWQLLAMLGTDKYGSTMTLPGEARQPNGIVQDCTTNASDTKSSIPVTG